MTSAGISTHAALASQPSQHSLGLIAANPSVTLPRSVEQAVRQDLSQRLNVPLQNVKLVRFTPQTWSDGCLGLGGAAESCLQAQVEGWRVEVIYNQQTWIYRTDKTANVIRLEPLATGEVLPPIVSQRLISAVAKEVRVPATRLQIAHVKSAVWDGCLGIFTPGRGCTKIALQGWQVVIASSNRSWVYHLDQDGSRIVQNPTASGSRGGLVPAFIPEQTKPEIESTIVFRSTIGGSLLGRVTQTTLTTDGAITQLITAPNIRSRPVVIKRLSQQQVEEFQQTLQTQRFLNLNGLRYFSKPVIADYPTTTLQGMGSVAQYVVKTTHLPKALRQVIQAWEKL
ncbi:hypothetical protein FM036_46380 [Nostoc sp. HG1]|nr:hypothetical protein [Nostoc sp. HG1]